MAVQSKIALFSARGFEKSFYQNDDHFQFDFFDCQLNSSTVKLCKGYEYVSCFVNDRLDRSCLKTMSDNGVKIVALRCAGYNNVDLSAAEEFDVHICRVPGYSPQSIAEFVISQILCLTRKIHRSYQRTRDLNFSLEGLVGQSLSQQTVGVIGVGKIGRALIHILQGFGCEVLGFDRHPSSELEGLKSFRYVEFDTLIKSSNVISLNVPLNSETHHLIAAKEFKDMRQGSYLINTGRGGLVDSKAVIEALKTGKIQGLAIDVYEEEENYFDRDFSSIGIADDTLARLVSFPNVLVTAHQGFLTETSLTEIASSVYQSFLQWKQGCVLANEIKETFTLK